MSHHDGIEIIIRGPHNSGRTTAARFIEEALKGHGYQDVRIKDTQPLSATEKEAFPSRLYKNMEKPVRIRVEQSE